MCVYIFSFVGWGLIEILRATPSEWRERLSILIIIKILNWQIPYQVRNDCSGVILSDSEISLTRFVWDSSASRAEGENRKFIIGKSIFSIWIWVYPFSARRSRLRPLNDCSGLIEILRLSALNDELGVLDCHIISCIR